VHNYAARTCLIYRQYILDKFLETKLCRIVCKFTLYGCIDSRPRYRNLSYWHKGSDTSQDVVIIYHKGYYNSNVIIIIIMRVIYIAPKDVKQTHRRSHCTSAKRMTSILRNVAEAFPPARRGTILNSHRFIGITTNTSVVLNCALVTGCSLMSYPGLLYGNIEWVQP